MNTTLFRMLRFLALALCALILSFNSKLVSAAEPSVGGQWEQGPTFDDYPIHMHVLPTGKLMWWPGNSLSGDDPKLFDYNALTLTDLPQAGFDIFCSAHTFLADGRLLISGGHVDANVGLPDATIFDYRTNTWHKQPSMNLARWYPSSVLLPNNDVVVVAGSVDVTTGSNPLPQVYETAKGTWRDLSSAQLSLPVYPKLFLAPNGKIFNAGPTVTTRYLDTVGTGQWTVVGEHVYKEIRDYGGAATYAPGKIIVVGGHGEFPGTLPTNTAEIIDLNESNPAWKAIEPMQFPRRHPNVNVLPDGKVLVIGGTKGTGDDMSAQNVILTPELWDPATGKWTALNDGSFRRTYHSNSVLLPDGRIFITGGNFVYETEFYSPPYLFQGPRPTISSAPDSVNIGQTFFVGTPDATSIDTVTWVRLPSVTHSTDFNQGFIQSTNIQQAEGGINIVAPDNTVIPAGHYMLFLLRGGVPSVAKIVRLDRGSALGNPVPEITTLMPDNTTNGNAGFTLIVNGNNFVAGSVVKWNGASRPTTVSNSSLLTAQIPASDIAAAGTAQVTVTNPAPGGGTSAPKNFTIETGVNLTFNGSIIARVTAPTGGGSRNINIIRDGVKPLPGSTNQSQQYDTYDGNNTSPDDWIGYQYGSPQTFNKVVFEEGRHNLDGGWFSSLTVQVLQNGSWVNVQNLSVAPAYPNANNGVNFETYTLRFSNITGSAIRIYGDPGGSADFISVAELEVYGPVTQSSDNPVPTLSTLSPASKTAGESGFTLTVNGSNFVSGSVVNWKGASRTTSFVSPTQLTAAIPASDITTAGTAQVTVTNPAPGGGTSAAQTFTINTGSGGPQNLSGLGSIIARVTAPTGGGSKNLETIRDGIKPNAGSTSSSAQYDTYDGNNAAATDWIGYQYNAAQTFDKVVFQEGKHYGDGGWFASLTVQVLQNGTWNNVSNLTVAPAYPNANNGTSYETYTLQFTAVSGTGIRIFGDPGGSADFISVGELEVYGSGTQQNNPAPVLASIAPSSKTAGDPGFTLTVNGSSFVSGAVVKWNGANRTTTFVSATQLTAAIPASDIAATGTAQITVTNPTPGGGTSTGQSFTITSNSGGSQNLAAQGTPIARVTAPTGGGSKNLETIRDGVKPAPNSVNSLAQYDTYDGSNTSATEWIGYQFSTARTFDKVVFQEGRHFGDGGWFASLTVQVRQNGTWVSVQNLVVTPAYPNINNGTTFETYNLQFTPISGDGIRIFGDPGGSADFISVGELEVYGQAP